MPRRRTSGSRRKKTGLDLLAAVLVAIGAVLCIIFGILIPFALPGSEYAFGFISALIDGPIVIAAFAIVFGVIIIVIEGYNKLYDFWSIILIFILAIFAGTVGALLIIIGCLLAIIQKVRRE
jgi:hypothetical protein